MSGGGAIVGRANVGGANVGGANVGGANVLGGGGQMSLALGEQSNHHHKRGYVNNSEQYLQIETVN